MLQLSLVIGLVNSPITEPDVLPVNNVAYTGGKNIITSKATREDNGIKPKSHRYYTSSHNTDNYQPTQTKAKRQLETTKRHNSTTPSNTHPMKSQRIKRQARYHI